LRRRERQGNRGWKSWVQNQQRIGCRTKNHPALVFARRPDKAYAAGLFALMNASRSALIESACVVGIGGTANRFHGESGGRCSRHHCRSSSGKNWPSTFSPGGITGTP
jgi:hypothetical protein